MVGIINYGMGNLQSVKNALEFINVESRIESDPSKLDQYDHVILPGVGAFGLAMENLSKANFVEAINNYVHGSKKPFMGICLGMQLVFNSSSEHGDHKGLGLVEGKVSFFGDVIKDLPVPHVGWNQVKWQSDSILLKGLDAETSTFYFVHSYYCASADSSARSYKTAYGIEFDAMIEKDNIFACQFHPEKSQKSGLTILKNFTSL